MKVNDIPSEDQFSQAREARRQRDEGLNEVREKVLTAFSSDGLHQAFVLYSPRGKLFVTYLFFSSERQKVILEQSGTVDRIKTFVVNELERAGKGKGASLRINFEIDTDENVQNVYNGDYYARLS